MEKETKFKDWCAAKGYTAKYVAERTGISVYTVYAYFVGERYPSRRTLKKLEEVFGESMRDKFPY